MKKFLFFVVLAVMITACDSYERKPLGDMKLTWVKNLSANLQGLESGGLEVLPIEYDSITLAWHLQKQSVIVAEKDGKQSLFNYTIFDPKNPNRMDKIVTGDKISVHEIGSLYKRLLCVVETAQGKMVYMPEMPYTRNEASTDWVSFGPFDEVYCDIRDAITKKGNLYGIVAPWGHEIKPQFEEIYIEHGWFGPKFIARRPNQKQFDVGSVSLPLGSMSGETKWAPYGCLSSGAVKELKSAAKTSVNGLIWDMEDVSDALWNKYKKAFSF